MNTAKSYDHILNIDVDRHFDADKPKSQDLGILKSYIPELVDWVIDGNKLTFDCGTVDFDTVYEDFATDVDSEDIRMMLCGKRSHETGAAFDEAIRLQAAKDISRALAYQRCMPIEFIDTFNAREAA